MWIRSAYWVGAPRDTKAFEDAIDSELVPALGTLPGVTRARALWPRRLEDNPPAIYCQVIVEFEDFNALETMLASAERRAMRERVREVAAFFEGHISHIDFEVGVAK